VPYMLILFKYEECESMASSGSVGVSHTDVSETTSFQREDFTIHGPHLNSTRQKKLTLLIVKSLGDKNVSGTSSIPVINSAGSSPSFSLRQKHKGA